MTLAEKKRALLRAVEDADDETTAKLIDFMESLDRNNSFSEEDLEEFNRRREEYLKNPDTAIPWQGAMERMRKKLAR